MPDYGVPDEVDGVLDWAWGSERLERSRNYWVVTASPDARPHAMPVWGVWLPEQEEFVFSCADGARKARNLRANPRVTVAADDTVEVVSLEGVASEIRLSERPEVVTTYAAKYGTDDQSQGPSAAELTEFIGQSGGFVVRPERAFGLIERPDDFGPRATRWVW